MMDRDGWVKGGHDQEEEALTSTNVNITTDMNIMCDHGTINNGAITDR